MADISVIVPAYNAEKYLEKCLDSLVNQTKKNIEIIAVNDGSKDNTLKILNEYKSKYPDMIKVISQENQGLSVTRNNGIKVASGKYIVFVDSDDEIELDLLEKIWDKVTEFPYDIIAFDVNWIYPDKNQVATSAVIWDKRELLLEDKKKLLIDINVMACNKAYKKELFEDESVLFVPNTWFEDVLFTYKIIPQINSIAKIDFPGYKYFQRENSITYTFSDRLNQIHSVMDSILEYYKIQSLYDTYKDELEYIFVRYSFATYIKRLAKAKDKKKFNDGIRFVKSRVNEVFPNYKKNKYLHSGIKSFYLRNFNNFFAYLIFYLEKNKMN